LDLIRDVRAILFDKCFSCHGSDKYGCKASLRFDIEKETKEIDLMATFQAVSEKLFVSIATDGIHRRIT
jgi:hypothetical protein